MKVPTNALVAIAVVVAVVGGNKLLQQNRYPTAKAIAESSQISSIPTSNVFDENGIQIIEIAAKGGYSPYETTAKALLPTILRFVTDDTFDCSSSVIIPGLRLRKRLPLSGKTNIQLPTIPENTTLTVYCSMGMYYFNLNFVG